ncbi:hemerythrin domain-containing protein [Streptomyces natalensis]|uniref:Hemerythrin n=1 Tax=Streptomyces natalensis ATCC 27448 TaxID=1240678 RepID=A0A0D7CJP7_9ACTN|nr:hemerythrin domain-containing protein [Streptomyces natalensis]KIZ16085.1 hemerythrin [Streptomyces natalensis ATCC 27448]
MAHGGDIIEELTSDHREAEEVFRQITMLPSGHQDRKRLIDHLTIDLVRHSVAEEQYLYPTVRERLPQGAALADKEIGDHSAVEKLLKRLEGCAADDPQLDQLFMAVKEAVTSHVEDEENHLFPQLRRACSPEELAKLGDKVRMAKKAAPTRPHPAAPTTPPANKLLAPGLGLVDRARDYVTGRGRS